MFIKDLKPLLIILFILFIANVGAQNNSSQQLPSFLHKSYFGLNVGVINHPFSQSHLEPGFTFHSLEVPPISVRLVLFGYQFNKSFSAQISYMRPVAWMKYHYTVDELTFDHLLNLQVWMNYASLDLKYRLFLSRTVSVYAEGSYSVVTRNGYTGWYGSVVKNANYNSIQLGAGISYHLNNKWDLQLGGVFSPENKKEKQPYTSFVSAGFNYRLQSYPVEHVEKTDKPHRIQPKQMIQLGYLDNGLGYGINNTLESVYLFWGGDVEVSQGFTFDYQQNILYSKGFFSMDWGTSFGWWQSKLTKESFFTLSIYPLLRFTFFRAKTCDVYLFYSVAGPTFISHTVIDEIDTGGHFTFQDRMGLGIFFGENRSYNAELRIGHYSNGNLLPRNPGIKIPLSFNLGCSF